MPIFELKLQQSYYANGFFNVTVDYDRYVRKTEGPLRLRLGRNGVEVQAKLSRHANQNGTPRISGGVPLRKWFQRYFNPMDIVAVDLSSEDILVLDKISDPV
jgi:hypothetical protein